MAKTSKKKDVQVKNMTKQELVGVITSGVVSGLIAFSLIILLVSWIIGWI